MAGTAAPYKLPQFRSIPAPLTAPEVQASGTLRLLADADFAPFSFASAEGRPSGLAVDLALAACAAAKLDCEVMLLPYGDLLTELGKRKGDAVISGPRIDEAALSDAAATRPWFRTLARFAVANASPIAGPEAAALSGKRIAVVKGSAHEAWLDKYYGSASVLSFASEAEAGAALKSGKADALFGDNLHVIYWVAGQAAAGCCKLLGHAFSDPDSFSRNLAFFIRSDRADLRAAFDYGLDRLQADGITDKIFNKYVPLNPW